MLSLVRGFEVEMHTKICVQQVATHICRTARIVCALHAAMSLSLRLLGRKTALQSWYLRHARMVCDIQAPKAVKEA